MQLLMALRMVYLEKVLNKYDVPPPLAVGWEGFLGFLTLSLLLIPMYYIPVGVEFGQNPRHVLEDALDGFHQLAHNNLLLAAYCSVSLSVSLFNWSVFTLTKERVFGLLKLSTSHQISCIFLCLHSCNQLSVQPSAHFFSSLTVSSHITITLS